MKMRRGGIAILLAGAMLALGCDDDDGNGNDAAVVDASNPGRDATVNGDSGASGSDAKGDTIPCTTYTENVSACTPGATDYQPRKLTPGSNGWPTCISDDNKWHLIGSSIPAAASRSQAFETMALKLWRNSHAPTKDDFLSARDDYSVAEGLASRVARRQDISYAEIPGENKFACQNEGVPAQYPDRCAGPAKLKPIIDDAFQKGIAGTQPIVQAMRIEAALLWFFYLSVTSEVWTCSFDNIGDCDSAAGYYTQITARDTPAGLAAYVKALGPETHNRIYDGLLAERCWRDIDKAMPSQASSQQYYDIAQHQLNKATLRGEALILRERIGKILCASGDERQGHIEFVKILGGLLDHAASLIKPAKATQLKAYTSNPTADAVAISAAQALLDELFACP